MAAQRAKSLGRGLLASLVLVLASCGALLAPRLVVGYTALQWTRYYCRRNAEEPRLVEARPAGRWAARAIDGLAPLPPAWEAAELALDLGRRLQRKDVAAARLVLTPVREALGRAAASPLRRYGLGDLPERAEQVEKSLRLEPEAGELP